MNGAVESGKRAAAEVLAAHMLAKVILRDLDGVSGAQGREVSDQHLRLDGVRMVVVDEQALLNRKARAIAVVGVVIDDHDSAPRQPLDESLRDGRFSRTGSPTDAEDKHGRHLTSPGPSFLDSRSSHDIRFTQP